MSTDVTIDHDPPDHALPAHLLSVGDAAVVFADGIAASIQFPA